MIVLSKIAKEYRGRAETVTALADINLHVKAGELVSIQGPSGCGKTTLLLTAGTMLRPTEGQVTIDGEDPYAMSAEARSRFRAEKIGFVFQQFHLIPYLDIIGNIQLPALAAGKADGAAADRAAQLAEQFKLGHRRHHKPSELSAGEKQRTGLARAMMLKPPCILADEPTGNLDPENGQIVLDALKAYTREGGAVLLVTHDPQAATHADRTLHIQNGKLI